MQKVVYILSGIDKSLEFEWVASYLDRTQFQLTFILLNDAHGDIENHLNKLNIKYHYLPYTSKKHMPIAIWKIYRLLKSIRPDIVHTHLIYACMAGMIAAWLAGVKKRIATRHHATYHQVYFPQAVKYDKLVNKLATQVVAISNAVVEALKLEHIDSKKIRMIYHGFDMAEFAHVEEGRIEAVASKYGIRGHYPVIGVIARYVELKGIQYVLDAYEKLLSDYPDALLVLANARGPYKESIQSKLKGIPVKNYVEIPFEKDLAALYRQFDYYINVPIQPLIDAFSMTYVEALASGIPSIFTLSGVAPDFITHEKNALVVDFQNSEEIYQSLRRLLGDKELSESLHQAGPPSVADKFSLDTYIKPLENLYNE